jgi:2'-5' RNA ligase
MSLAQRAIHDLLRAQYGLITAGLFMPHATLKGFFRSDATVEEMRERLDREMAGWQTFTAYNNGVGAFGPRTIVIGLKHLPDGSVNHPIYDLQERAWSALGPLIHPGCEFSPHDPRGLDGSNPFHPHLTQAMSDLKAELQDEVLEFIAQTGPVGPPQFRADTCHLFRFEADWDRDWTRTLRWELLESWRATAATGDR